MQSHMLLWAAAALLLNAVHTEPVTLPINIKHRLGYTKQQLEHNHHLTATTGSLGGCYATDFTISTTIGSQGPFNLVLDTGSTTMAVVSNTCPTSGNSGCDGASPTYTASSGSSGTADAEYGIGGFQGNIYTDSVSVAGTQGVNTKFVAINNNNQFFVDGDCSSPNDAPDYQGILGMGFARLELSGTGSWFDNYVKQYNVPNIFSMNVPTKQLTLGGVQNNIAQFRNVTLDTSNSNVDGYYGVDVNSITVAGTTITPNSNDKAQGFIIDTGTNAISLTNHLFTAVVAQITANSYFQQLFPSDYFTNINHNCVQQGSVTTEQLNAQLPSIEFTFATGGTSVSVVMAAVPGWAYPVQTILPGQSSVSNALCVGITDGGDGAVNILGLPLIGQFETSFDKGAEIVGFYPVLYPTLQTNSIPTIISNNARNHANTASGSVTVYSSMIAAIIVSMASAVYLL